METRDANNSTFKNFVIGPPYTLHHSDSGNKTTFYGHNLLQQPVLENEFNPRYKGIEKRITVDFKDTPKT
jgi:hypothetical protein